MRSVGESLHVPVPPEPLWRFYFDPETWPAWVDGFARVESSQGYPQPGGSLTWRSTPAGRGLVTERVLEHDPPQLHRVAFADEGSEGELRVSFDPERAGTRVAQQLRYRLRDPGTFASLTDLLFIRSQMQRSLGRSLERLRLEAAETM